jgi:hypothetical protein
MRTSAAVVVGFVIGVVAVAVMVGQDLVPLPLIFGGQPTAMCKAVVRVSLDTTGHPQYVPDPVCLAKHRELTWEFDSALDAGEVTIDFVKQGNDKGPFKEEPMNINPHGNGKGSYVRHAGDNSPVRSNAAEKAGQWSYNITYTPPKGSGKPVTIDPVVCVRK